MRTEPNWNVQLTSFDRRHCHNLRPNVCAGIKFSLIWRDYLSATYLVIARAASGFYDVFYFDDAIKRWPAICGVNLGVN